MTFASRRLRAFCITVVLAVLLVWVTNLYDLTLRDASYLTGWLLFGGMLFLAAYNLRKKLPFLPLQRSALWLQFHIYLGWLIVVLFLLHTSAQWPTGILETALWVLFVLVAGSGVVGIFLSRVIPLGIQDRGERLIYERIPQFRAELAADVEALATKSLKETGSNTIASYYVDRLQPFFSGPSNLFAHLHQSQAAVSKIRRELSSLHRYQKKGGQEILAEMEELVVAKDNLDYQLAMQSVLKFWLFLHIPLTYAMLLVSVVHVVLTYAFSGATL